MTDSTSRRTGRVARFPRRRARAERGDVPGWVLVTLMSAGLVAVLWTFAGDKLESMLAAALDKVGAHE